MEWRQVEQLIRREMPTLSDGFLFDDGEVLRQPKSLVRSKPPEPRLGIS